MVFNQEYKGLIKVLQQESGYRVSKFAKVSKQTLACVVFE